jgi:hypothetical protein
MGKMMFANKPDIPTRLFWFMRRKVKWYLHCIFKNGIEWCDECGGTLEGIWWTSNSIWLKISGSYPGSYCHRCFDRLCDDKGISLLWIPQVYPEVDDGSWNEMRKRMETDPHYTI